MILKSLMLLSSLVGRFSVLFSLIGLLNKRYRFLKSIFLCYAGDQRYSGHYGFSFTNRLIKWFPTPIGVFKQGAGWGLIVATPASERELTDYRNRASLLRLLARVTHFSRLLDIDCMNYSGILPSFFSRHMPERNKGNVNMTGLLVINAIEVVAGRIDPEKKEPTIPLVLLGGNGYVGKQIQNCLGDKQRRYRLYIVDPSEGLSAIPTELRGTKTILVDVSRRNVIRQYIKNLWKEMVILNETFPEPSATVIKELSRQGIQVIHIAGVQGRVFPSLPFAYANCVPCCAIHDTSAVSWPILLDLSEQHGKDMAGTCGVRSALIPEIRVDHACEHE